MAKKEIELYDGLPVIEASDAKSLEKKLAIMTTWGVGQNRKS